MESKTAKFIKDVSNHFSGTAYLFKVDPPMEYCKPWSDDDPPAKLTEYIVVSAAYAPFSGPETYIFPSDEEGNVTSWGELDGSYRGGTDIYRALENAGYERE